MPNGTYGGVRGRKTKVGRKLSFSSYSILPCWFGFELSPCHVGFELLPPLVMSSEVRSRDI